MLPSSFFPIVIASHPDRSREARQSHNLFYYHCHSGGSRNPVTPYSLSFP